VLLKTPSSVAVDETTIKINGGLSWLYAAIDLDTKCIPDVQLFGRHGTDPAAAFLARHREKHDLSDATFLADQFVYQTALYRLRLSGWISYTDRNLIETWFHTLKMCLDASTTSGWPVGQAHTNGLNSSCITTTIRDRTNRLVEITLAQKVLNCTVPLLNMFAKN
jgi:transposase-like protein